MKDQSANSNRTSMKHASFSAITIWSEEIAISRAHLDKTLIHTNQASASIDRWGNGYQEFSFGGQKICDKIGIDFGWNTNNRIPVNPSITIGSITPHITIM